MNTNGKPTTRTVNVARSVSGLLHDAIELTELQAQLIGVDCRDAANKGRSALVLAIAGSVLLLGAVPVGLLGLAQALVTFAGMSLWGALLVSMAGGMLLGVLLTRLAWQKVQCGIADFDRSKREFQENLKWIKSALRGKQREAEMTEYVSSPGKAR